MRKSNRLALLAVALVSAACGQWTPPLPTAPSDASKGAIISGTVNGLRRSAESTTPPTRAVAAVLAVLDTVTFATPVRASAGFTVTVVGTSITATFNDSGKFVLEGVPMGNIQLRFTGEGVDAQIDIRGVKPEHIQLVVTLNGSNATIDSINRVQTDNLAELEGLITSISHGDRSMKVNGFEIKVREAPIHNGSQRVDISTLSVGQRVRIKGTWVHDSVVATEVLVTSSDPTPTPNPDPNPPSNGGSGQTIEGVITTFRFGDRSMVVNGFEVKIWDAPIYQGGQRVGLSLLAVGQRVQVTGTWVHDHIVAQRVDIR
jgi:hypothetical protein